MAEKQLIVALEGTAAMGPYWQSILSDYLEKIIRSFCGNDMSGQKPVTVSYELALVMFTSHGSYCASLVQRSGWTRDVDIFLQWLSAIPFGGGGFNDAAIAEGLAEALMMFAPNGSQTQQNVDVKKHCVLISASNPYPLPTPIYRPKFQSTENENVEAVAESRLSDAETIAKSYSQGFVSLSVICPKQLPKLRTIFNAGKRNPRSPDPPVDNKNAHSLVLVSENFMEARAALSRSGVSSLPATQSPVKMDIAQTISVSGPPPASVPAANGAILNRQSVPVGNGPTATVKVEPTTVTSMAAAPTFPHVPPVARPTLQGPPVLQTSSPPVSQEVSTNTDTAQDMKPVVSGGLSQQPARPTGPANSNILNNLSQVRQVVNSAALTGGTSIGLQTMNQNPMAMHVSNMISSGMQSSVPAAQNVYSSAQSGVTSMTGSGTGAAQVAQNPALGSFAPATSNMSGNSNLGMSQPTGNLQVAASMAQTVQGMSQGNLSGPQMVGMNQNIMNGLGPAGSSTGNGSMMPTPGMTQQGMQSIGGGNNPGASMPLSQQSSSALQTAQSKYVKVWEGSLSGQRQGQPVFITKLEGYRSASASETLAANWPPTMQIVRLISQDHMNNKQYVGKADFLVFRAMNQHGFLGQLQEKKLCAVIQLPSQTLLLSVSDKACRLIGMLFPGDMVVFKPQMPSQQQQQQQQLQQPMQMQQQQQQPMQMQPQQQPMQMQQQQQPMQMQQQPMQMQQQQMQQMQQQQQQQQQQQPQMPQLQQQQQPQMSQLQQQQMPQQQQMQQMPQQQQMQQMQQPQLNQIQQQQQIQQMQQQQQLQQQQRPPQQQSSQPMVGAGMGQGGYGQGPRAQLVSQGQIPSQGPNSLPGGGGGFMN